MPRGGVKELGSQLQRRRAPGGEGKGYDRRDALVRGVSHEELQAARAVLGQQLISYRQHLNHNVFRVEGGGGRGRRGGGR